MDFFQGTQKEEEQIGLPPEVDTGGYEYDEPTSPEFKPRITPGVVTFRFEPTNYEDREVKTDTGTITVPEITFTAHVSTASLGPGRLLADTSYNELAIRFNRAAHFKTAAMKQKHVSTDIERLYKALGLLEEFGPPKSVAELVTRVRGAAGRHANGVIWWEAAKKFEGGTEVFSTAPKTKLKNPQKPWPKDERGQLALQVTFADGSTKFGKEVLGKVYPIKKDESAEIPL